LIPPTTPAPPMRLYKSLNDKSLNEVPFLVKDNFKFLSRALFDTDGGSTHAYTCLRSHSIELYDYMLLRSITDVNLFDTIRYGIEKSGRTSFPFHVYRLRAS
jgi:hypothetical protein